MNDPEEGDPNPRKPWYKRAVEAVTLWRPSKRPMPTNKRRLRKCSSLRIPSSLGHVCLCAPIASYNGVFAGEKLTRRSYSYPRSRNSRSVERPRVSTEGRRAIFRGKSLTENLLMRRFLMEEKAAIARSRRRSEMEIVRRKVEARRRKIGPSRLSRMSMAGDHHHQQQQQHKQVETSQIM